jgi:hypothetical protein
MATQPAKPKTKAKKAVADEPVIHSIKGFDANLQCRGYQFKEGETYEHTGSVKVCNSGFHACTIDAHPLEVFGYYPPAGSRFHLVEQRGETNSDDSIKIASAKITIGYELSIGGLTKRAIEWVFARSKPEGENATGNQGAASVTGEQGAASATGEQGAASATGWQGAAMSCGYKGTATGALGNALFAVERDDNYNIISVAAGIVGKDGIELGAIYRCSGGKLVLA